MKLRAIGTLGVFALAAILCVALMPAPSVIVARGKIEGKIVKRPFKTKHGTLVRDTYDLFFETDNTEYFIKMSESKITQSDAMRYLNKPISIKGKIKEGNWDSSNPKAQSRIGEYLIIKKIMD